MYIKARPVGTTPPLLEDRIPLWRAVSGDQLWLTTQVNLADSTPATPVNSRLKFALSETRFHFVPIWVAEWNSGIAEVNAQEQPGLVKIKIPANIASELRRGVYSFSLAVSDAFGNNTATVLIGNLLIEYEPTSPEHDIPYKSQEGE